MSSSSFPAPRRTEKLDLRVSPAAKAKLQAAAVATHRTMSDFVMESALASAEQALAERRIFSLDEDAWNAFQAALDAPPRRLPHLQALLAAPGFFDEDAQP